MIKDAELNAQTLVEAVDKIMSNEALRQSMAEASKSEGIPNASERLYRLAKSITRD